jgi:hypothetical protein
MILSIRLSDEVAAALSAKAKSRGLSVEQYAQHVLEEDLEKQPGAEGSFTARPISEGIAQIMAATPPEELATLPVDGASEHDHYVYGWPKRKI